MRGVVPGGSLPLVTRRVRPWPKPLLAGLAKVLGPDPTRVGRFDAREAASSFAERERGSVREFTDHEGASVGFRAHAKRRIGIRDDKCADSLMRSR